MRTVYLAGPIAGTSEDDAKSWRAEAIQFLSGYGIVGVTPLRNEPAVGGRYLSAEEWGMTNNYISGKAISAKNLFDVRNCDMTLVYLPKFSYGTVLEIGWAFAYNKPVVLVTEDQAAWNHPCVDVCVGWKVKTLKEGLNIVQQILEPYV